MSAVSSYIGRIAVSQGNRNYYHITGEGKLDGDTVVTVSPNPNPQEAHFDTPNSDALYAVQGDELVDPDQGWSRGGELPPLRLLLDA